MAVDSFYLRGVDEGTLDADRIVAAEKEHVALADELIGAGAVEDCLAVYARHHFESHAGREVGLDGSGDDVRGWALGCDDHVHPDGSGQLCDAGYG